MSKAQPNILLAGGGTGGHLYPALAIADEIKNLAPNAVLWFVGTSKKIEARVVPQHGYPFRTIWISGFHRAMRLSNLVFPLKLVVSLLQSFFLIRRFQPDVVVGTGGYVCGPVLSAASLLGIPTVIHESNSYPGVSTRLLAARATKVFLAFETTKKWLSRTENTELVGTPTRESLEKASREESLNFFHLDRMKRTVLVFGGSLGAASINNAILATIDQLIENNVQLIWQTGWTESERIEKAVAEKHIGWVGPFIDRMEFAYAAADVVVCRAGATTLAELTRVGKAAILIPYPLAAADHQTVNASTMVEAGAALMVHDGKADTEISPTLLALLRDEHRLKALGEASKKCGHPDAGTKIAEKILCLIQ